MRGNNQESMESKRAFSEVTWKIIPVGKWLGSPPFISHGKPIWKGSHHRVPRGQKLTMVMNHEPLTKNRSVGEKIRFDDHIPEMTWFNHHLDFLNYHFNPSTSKNELFLSFSEKWCQAFLEVNLFQQRFQVPRLRDLGTPRSAL